MFRRIIDTSCTRGKFQLVSIFWLFCISTSIEFYSMSNKLNPMIKSLACNMINLSNCLIHCLILYYSLIHLFCKNKINLFWICLVCRIFFHHLSANAHLVCISCPYYFILQCFFRPSLTSPFDGFLSYFILISLL